ncbi:MAG: ABC transporter substrate-binding protein [Deltaproteobacteria bacterium]|nr:ABC transporter substrate-binding protein [Deltaproteobacteria bacterium]
MKRLCLLILVSMAFFLIFAPPGLARDADTLIVVQESEPVGLDLMRSSLQNTMSVCYNIHDTLFHPQQDASVKPALAEKWEQIGDLAWKVTLRKGITFHNGEPLDTKAVKFSFDRVFDPEIKSPHKGKLSAFKEVKILDDLTFEIKTEKPFAPGLYMLAIYLPIVPPEYIKKVGNTKFNTDPVGCGPYQLSKWVRGESVILERYEKYYGPKPFYGKVVFKTIPEATSRVAALVTGEADVISGIAVHQRKKILSSGKAYLTSQMGVMPYLGINTYEKPFNDVRVRQALNYSIHRALINKALFNDKAILCKGPISPRTFGSDPSLKPYPYDPAKAKALLKEAGYPDGIQVRLAYPTYMSQIQEQAEAIGANLAEAGIQATLEPFERAVMWERYKGKKHQLYVYWWDDAPEPDRYMYSLFNSKSRDYYYKNEEVDALLDKGRTILDRAERAKVYNEIDRILYKDSPWAFLYVIPEVFGVSNAVFYEGDRDGFLNMRWAKPKS